ncbi:hypothetical protein C5167_018237 [Papaver somniferum]|uniref:Uncharacterized protein n=1 Tax=Papaver somniferum TaxID=3469 RepID=A0A4Y7IQR3_PAPSO|nr:hypothetical protein C5167_018237 [Papaver somniferum]
MKHGSPEGGFPTPYGDGYGLHQMPSGAAQSADKGPMYGVGSGSWAGLDKHPQLGNLDSSRDRGDSV